MGSGLARVLDRDADGDWFDHRVHRLGIARCTPDARRDLVQKPSLQRREPVGGPWVLCDLRLAFSLPQFLQYVSDYSPLQAALRTLPFALAALIGNVVGEPVIAWIGTRWTIIAGLLITAASFLLFATVGPGTGDVVIILAGSLLGFGAGISGTASFTSVLQSVPSEKAGSASAVNETGIELGNALGLAVLGTVLSSGFTRILLESPLNVGAKIADNIVVTFEEAQRLGGADGKALKLAAQSAFSGSMDNMSLIGTVVVVAGALVAWIYLPKRDVKFTQ